MPRLTIILLAASLLAACTHQIQMSSGTDYLARYSEAAATGAAEADPKPGAPRTDSLVRAAASVEPDLRLPARFGLARLVNGRLTAIPEAEATLWQALAERQKPFGEFVAISPLLAEFTAHSVSGAATPHGHARNPREIVQTIRLGAARQHVDAVLIYEVGARASRESTWLALADLTLIGGAFLPTRALTATGRAEALLLGVRNGYPYGTASALVDLSALHPSWGSERRTAEMQEEAVLRVVENLVPDVESMMRDLAATILKRQTP
jgi:hypothetical protein